jgi:hypothetical protein
MKIKRSEEIENRSETGTKPGHEIPLPSTSPKTGHGGFGQG